MPRVEPGAGPVYLAIADAIAEALASGELRCCARLPPHRDLADALGVTTGTVTRAYAEAARRGLVRGEVGRGTFVVCAEGNPLAVEHAEQVDPALVDFSLNVPPPLRGGTHASLPGATLRELARRDLTGMLFEYQPSGGTARQRAAGARWLDARGLPDAEGRTLLALGGQHGLSVLFSTLFAPGDVVATEDLTYTGVKALAQRERLRLVGLPLDGEGMRPDALDTACRMRKVHAIYCIPTVHNPTTATMSLARREEIVGIAREHGVTIIEDDVHGALVEHPPPPIAALAPELTYHVSTLSKSVGPGLRVAYVATPRGAMDRIDGALRTSTWMPVPLTAELATGWIESGEVDALLAESREELRARRALADELLEGVLPATQAGSPHLWILLPEPWRSDDFARHALSCGVRVAPCSVFVVGRSESPHAIRVGLGGPRSREVLEAGLRSLGELLRAAPPPGLAVV